MSRKLRIAMILDNEFTGDMRVENEVIALQEAGHTVFVLCLNHGGKPPQEDFHGAKIIRIPLSKWRTKKMRALVNTHIDPYTYFWRKNLTKLIEEEKIDVIHAHDLYLVKAALKAGKATQKPVVADLHENYPEALKNYKFTNRFPAKYIVSIKNWEAAEKIWLQEADCVITVIEEAVERYINLGIPEDKLTVVPNYVNIEEFLDDSEIPEFRVPDLKNQSALYIGGFDLHRGLESIVRALPDIKKHTPVFKLTLVGSGSNEQDLKNLSNELNVSEMLEFMGWRNPAELPGFIKKATICLIPHLKTPHTDNTIPHKLFHYMIMGKPVLTSNCNPLERIVLESGAGKVFQSNDPKDFAQKIKLMLENPDEVYEMGQSGQKAVLEKYKWDKGKENLVKLYDGFIKKA